MMMNNNLKILVNDQWEWDAASIGEADLIPDGDNRFHLIRWGKTYHAELLAADLDNRSYTIRIGGENFTVRLENELDQLINQMGLKAGKAHVMKDVRAPMPGLVLQLLVNPGDKVAKDDPLLILEAMKMENVLKATGEGTVKSLRVKKGAVVEKGAVLLEME